MFSHNLLYLSNSDLKAENWFYSDAAERIEHPLESRPVELRLKHNLCQLAIRPDARLDVHPLWRNQLDHLS